MIFFEVNWRGAPLQDVFSMINELLSDVLIVDDRGRPHRVDLTLGTKEGGVLVEDIEHYR